jgi:hypothetical protein
VISEAPDQFVSEFVAPTPRGVCVLALLGSGFSFCACQAARVAATASSATVARGVARGVLPETAELIAFPCPATLSGSPLWSIWCREHRGVAVSLPVSAETAEKPRLLPLAPSILPAALRDTLGVLVHWSGCKRWRAADAFSKECAVGRADVGGFACGQLGAGCAARERVSPGTRQGIKGAACILHIHLGAEVAS